MSKSYAYIVNIFATFVKKNSIKYFVYYELYATLFHIYLARVKEFLWPLPHATLRLLAVGR